MKIFLLFILLAFTGLTNAQTSVTQPAGNGATSPSNACMACPGSGWNNEMNIVAQDGVPADVGLMQNGFCFQSTCFTSRYLLATQFGFSVPGTATMLGIEINITRKATDTTAIRDSIVQLITGGAPAGIVKKDAAYWDTSYTTITYGGPTDLWGSTSGFWTPAAINSSTTGVNLKILNTLATQSNSVYVDFISMTVYFSNSTGIIESQTKSPEMFFVTQSENQLSLLFQPAGAEQARELKIYDEQGQLVYSKDVTGLLSEKVEISNLKAGIYWVRVNLNDGGDSKKIMVVR